ncbi:MAG: hypothetical protein ACP5PM_05615 [Acidimicrobiales bacterium]
MEGYFGNLKQPTSGNVKGGWCRVVGIVKTSLLAACAAAATKMRLLRTWAEKRGGYDALCAPLPQDHGFEELTEEEANALKRSSQPPRAGPTADAA